MPNRKKTGKGEHSNNKRTCHDHVLKAKLFDGHFLGLVLWVFSSCLFKVKIVKWRSMTKILNTIIYVFKVETKNYSQKVSKRAF